MEGIKKRKKFKDKYPPTKLVGGSGKPRKPLDLSIKERMFIRDLFTTSQGDPIQAVARNFNLASKGQAVAKVNSILNKPQVKREVAAMLERAGLSDMKIGLVIKQGLQAKMPISYKGRVKSKYPDHSVRHKYLQTVLDLTESFPAKKFEGEIRVISEERKSELIALLMGIVKEKEGEIIDVKSTRTVKEHRR